MRYTGQRKYFRFKFIITTALVILVVAGSFMLYLFIGHADGQGKTHAGAVPSPTIPTATPSPSSTPQPLFYDDFTGVNKGWYLSDSAGYTRQIVNDSLLLSNTNHDVLIESLPTDRAFSDFVLTVVFTVVKLDWNNSIGVYVRGDSNLDHDYRVDIYGNDTYSISKEYLDAQKDQQSMYLAGPDATNYLNPTGQQNVLTVTMNGSAMMLRINGWEVVSLNDADYTQGQIALFVQGSPAAKQATALFDSVAVNSLPDQIPSSNAFTPPQSMYPVVRRHGSHWGVSAPSQRRQLQAQARGIPGAS